MAADESHTTLKSSCSLSLPPIQASALVQSSDIDQRGFSRKLHKMVSSHQRKGEENAKLDTKRQGRFEVKNWKQLSQQQMNTLNQVQKSRYMVYEPIPKEIVEKQMEALKRVRTIHQLRKEREQSLPLEAMIELEENSELIGQLKAAEARSRIRDSTKSYETYRKAELQHLIKSQPSAREAVRLKSFIPPSPVYVTVPDHLTKAERFRCESLLEDTLGLTINRTM